MKATDFSEDQVLRHMRRLVLIPIGWLVVAIVVPNFVLDLFDLRIAWVSSVAKAIGILLYAGLLAYLLAQVRKQAKLIIIVLIGLVFLSFSELVELAQSFHLLQSPMSDEVNKVVRIIENAANGLGVGVIGTVIIYAIIDMLAIRYRLLKEHGQLSQEIAGRKQVEESLRASEEALRFMVETVEDVFWQMASDFRFTYISPSVQTQTGFTTDEVVGRSMLAFLTPHSVAALEKLFRTRSQALQQGGKPVSATYEFEYFRKDKEIIWCEAISTPIFDKEGKLRGFQGVTRDITRRRRAEEALRESEVKYRELVENANSIILRMDRDGRVTFINEFAQRFFGFSENEILGKNVVGTIVPPADTEGRDLADMIRGIADDPNAYTNNENENIRRNGERVRIAWTNKPILFDADGGVQETLCVGNDITSRVHAERLLAEQRTQMIESARLASLGIMAGSIAHEINNPLAIIAGCAEQLEARFAAGEANAGLNDNRISMIRRNIARIERTIQGLRSLSRDASGDPFVETSASTIAEDTVELCQERFRLHNIYIEMENIDPAITVECRPGQIGQVILNLLNNSFDAIKDLPEKWITLSIAGHGEWVEVAVVDSGSGIPGEIAKRLFLPFFTTKSEEHGLGLGLSISHAIIEAHHGEIVADASCDHTRFLVRLPKHQPSSAKAG